MNNFCSLLSNKFLKLAEETVYYELLNFTSIISILCDANFTTNDVKQWATYNNLNVNSFFYTSNNFHKDRKYIYSYSEDHDTIVITDKYDNLPEMDMKSERLLLSYGPIPNLILAKGSIALISKDPKIIYENMFIVRSIRELSRFSDDIIIKLLKENEEKINYIRRLCQMQPKYLGGGADGIAYRINDSMVLKIFTNKFAYMKAKESQDLLFKNPNLASTEAMIYDVGEFKNDEYPIYYIIIEFFKNVTDKGNLESIIRHIESTISFIAHRSKFDIKQMSSEYYNKEITELEFKNKLKLFIQLVYRQLMESKAFKSRMKIFQNDERPSRDWLEKLIREIIFKKITERTDLHAGNLGINKRKQLRYFDPAYKTI